MAGELLFALLVEEVTEAGEVLIGLAGSELPGGVDLRGRSLLRLRVGHAPAADRVEGFEAEAERVDLAVAFCAGAVGAMLGEPLADGGRAGDVRLDGGHDVRRGRRLDAEDVLADPGAADDRGGLDAVGADGQDGRHAEQAAAMRIALEADLPEAVGEAEGLLFGQAVELGQLLVDEGMVGAEELVHRAVLLEQVLEEQARLGLHRGREVFRVVGPVGLAGRGHAAELAEVEPAVEEAVHEALEPVVSQQAVDLPLQLGVVGQFA